MHQEKQDGVDIGGQRRLRGISNHHIDVVPTLIGDPGPGNGRHFLAQFDARDAAGRPHRPP
jgi:hypothetical protein